jgi:ribonuclease R
MGQRASVKLSEVTPTTGGMVAELLELDSVTLPKSSRRGGSKGRKPSNSKGKRKVKRTRK